jgi:hypothetical protein
VYRGKVRDLYAVDDRHLLMVASDRLSAFDVILPTAIPGKGAVLTAVSKFWFARTRHIIPNHLQLAGKTLAQALPDPGERARIADRAVVARLLKGLPVEAIVRGYLIGSGWKDYQRSGEVCGITLPTGLRLADRLPEPIFTPSTKAALGAHDENVSFDAYRPADRSRVGGAGAGGEPAPVPGSGGLRLGAGHHHRRHQVRVRAGRAGSAGADGRGADAGLLAVLAGGSVPTQRQSAQLSTSSSCATTWKRWIGTNSRRDRNCRLISSPEPSPCIARRWSG